MAKGDAVSVLTDAVSGGNADYQPAAGVETLVTQVASDSGANDLDVQLYNGTLGASFMKYDSDTSGGSAPNAIGGALKILVNNTNYLRLTNGNAATKTVAFCGIQTK